MQIGSCRLARRSTPHEGAASFPLVPVPAIRRRTPEDLYRQDQPETGSDGDEHPEGPEMTSGKFFEPAVAISAACVHDVTSPLAPCSVTT